MLLEPKILVLRDPRESVNKCTLTPLRGRPDVHIERYRPDKPLMAEGRILLDAEGPVLTADDGWEAVGLLVVDSSWRRLPTLRRIVNGPFVPRSLPLLRSAYPRASREEGVDPKNGLASIEALFAAVALLWGADPTLLDHYAHRGLFLSLNPELECPS